LGQDVEIADNDENDESLSESNLPETKIQIFGQFSQKGVGKLSKNFLPKT
jgi:hypothetical protein